MDRPGLSVTGGIRRNYGRRPTLARNPQTTSRTARPSGARDGNEHRSTALHRAALGGSAPAATAPRTFNGTERRRASLHVASQNARVEELGGSSTYASRATGARASRANVVAA